MKDKMATPDHVKDQIKQRISITSLIDETVPLTKSGSSYTGFCPFHNNTKTAALAVFPDTNSWHCFGSCGEGGDVFSWVMRRDNLDFKAALETLAQKAGVSLNGNSPGPVSEAAATSKRPYTSLADYAQAHGVAVEVFKAAGWSETTHHQRPALAIKTNTGPRYRFTDDKDPVYIHGKGYRRAWYRLAQAVALAQDKPLIICNGEASTVVGQHYGLAALCLTSGTEKPTIPAGLLKELQAVYSGPVVVALDCDDAGRSKAPKLAQFLTENGTPARAVDLNLGHSGEDLADFCKLHQQQAATELAKLKEIIPKTTKEPEVKLKSSDYIAALNTLGYEFRLNDLDDTIEINEAPVTDIIAAEIRTRMRDIGYAKHLSAMEDAYITTSAQTPYHPVKAYLESLQYDGLPYIDTLTTYFNDQQDIFPVWLKKWLVGAVAKVYEQYQNPMLVLDGAQGKGKSYFSSWLCGPLHKYFFEGAIQPESNDHKLLLATTFIWEVTELGATTRKQDREALKGFLTLSDVTARKPYGRRPVQKPAMASFIGTVNDEAGFLNDPTGSRRFITCTLTGINWAYTEIDVNNIWSEAYHLYKNGYRYKLTAHDRERQNEINEHYEVDDPLIAEVLRYYDLVGGLDIWTSSRDILVKIGLDPLNPGHAMRLSRTMKKLKVEKGKQGPHDKRVNGFFGLQLAVVDPEKE
jgi:hypothetical protein